MTEHASSPATEPYAGGGAPGAPWADAMGELQTASTFWVATVHPTGRPHVVPVLAVVSGDALHVAVGILTAAGQAAHATETHGPGYASRSSALARWSRVELLREST